MLDELFKELLLKIFQLHNLTTGGLS